MDKTNTSLRYIAAHYRMDHAGCFPVKSGYVLIYVHPFTYDNRTPEAFGWSSDPKACDYKPGTFAVPTHGNGMIKCTFGGDDFNGAEIWQDMPNAE